ncbi:unnamed protein product, partial [Prorocentrum cordatum]
MPTDRSGRRGPARPRRGGLRRAAGARGHGAARGHPRPERRGGCRCGVAVPVAGPRPRERGGRAHPEGGCRGAADVEDGAGALPHPSRSSEPRLPPRVPPPLRPRPGAGAAGGALRRRGARRSPPPLWGTAPRPRRCPRKRGGTSCGGSTASSAVARPAR